MDESEPKKPRNPNDLLIFQNIDTEDHEWQYDAIKTPLPYYIRTGETRELPFFIATHGIEKLIDKMLMKANKIHTSPLFRKELRDKIVLGLKHINHIREKTANELALEALQRKKDIDPYEELLKEREIQQEQKAQQQAAAAAPVAPLIQTVGQPVQPIAPQVSNPESPIVPTATALNGIEAPVAGVDPERQSVYNLLTSKLHMDLSHVATREKLDATPVAQLKTEFASELPELANPATAVVADPAQVTTPTPVASQPVAPVPASVPAPAMNFTAPAAPLLDQQLRSA